MSRQPMSFAQFMDEWEHARHLRHADWDVCRECRECDRYRHGETGGTQ